jgi:hypothetical protein
MSLPEYNFIPAPLWLVTVLHVLTLTLHFVAMNFVLGGLLVLLFGRIENKWENPTVRNFVRLLPVAMAATVTLGVAPLLFVQLVYAKPVYAASITSAWFWLGIIGAIIVGYYFLYASSFSSHLNAGRLPVFLSLAAITAVYVAFVYSTVFSMVEKPDVYEALYAANQSGLVINTDVGSWIFRWIHMILGALTVGAFFVGVLGRNDEPVFSTSKKYFIGGMIAAMVVGFVYLFTLGDYILAVMRSITIWAVTVGLVLSLLALFSFIKRRFVITGLLLFVSLAAMVIARHSLRTIHLDGRFDPSAIPVSPQWSVFGMFLVFFVIALALVAYMIKALFSDQGQEA